MTAAATTESTIEDVEHLRHLLDIALQPLDRFGGFSLREKPDQPPIKSSAYRQQLCVMQAALAMAQQTRTPAFTGYLAEAQRNLIDKMRDPLVWGYWARTNLIGNQRWNPDPIVRDNVMYSGFLGFMVGTYERQNDDRRFSAPGGLQLDGKGRRRYTYDSGTLAAALRRNMRARPDHPQYPCQPHLVFPFCNAMAGNALVLHDRVHGTDLTGDLVERIRASYPTGRWIRPDGRFVGARTRRLGLLVAPSNNAYDASMAFVLHATMPDLATRTWERLRDHELERRPDGLHVRTGRLDRLNDGSHNVPLGDCFTRMMAMCAAREVGDEAWARALADSVAERHDTVVADGARQYAGVALLANATHVLFRFGRAGGLRDLVQGTPPPPGPLLAEVAYPDVLVLRATSDGERLDLVLAAGRGERRTPIGLGGLRPGTTYRLSGPVASASTTVVADATGAAVVDVDLSTRTEIRLCPEQ